MTAFIQGCRSFGVDPGSFLDDDVLAAQFRAAVAFLEAQEAPSEDGPQALPGRLSDGTAWIG